MNRYSKLAALMASVSMVLIAGCGGGGDTAGATAPAPAPAAPSGTISGKVVSSTTGLAVPGAIVNANGISATSGADGNYQLPGVPIGARVVVNVRTTTFADGLSVASVSAAATATVLTKLIPVGASTVIVNATGGDITVAGSQARVSLPANAFPAGVTNVTVAVTPVNPALDSSVMPGDYTINNGTQDIESFGALIVTPRDGAGNPVNLAGGKTATIRIPAVSRSGSFSPTIPLLYLDPTNGSWVQEGTATLAGVAPNQYYEGTVSHFSVWNADQIIDTVRVTGCVNDALGVPVRGVTVRSDGINYSGTSSAVTDNSGTFSVAMKRSGLATISGSQGAAFFSNTLTANPDTATGTFALTPCLVLTAAVNVATIKLTWGASPSDIDSHLYTPSGDRINFITEGSLQGAPYANLDVDDTSGFGPEVITINRLMVGTYTYGLDNFRNVFPPGIAGSPARVELNVGGRQLIFTPPAGETATTKFLRVFRMVVASNCSVTVETVNQWEAAVPTAPVATTPVYCVAP